MAEESKYEVYRVLQPIIKAKTASLFKPDMPDEQSREASIRFAIERAMTQQADWVAGDVVEIDGGLLFKIGHRKGSTNYDFRDGSFIRLDSEGMVVTDAIINFDQAIMLIRKDKHGPSSFLSSLQFKRWLTEANEIRQTGFDSIVQTVPYLEDFIQELQDSTNIERITFVVRGPNPADEDDIVHSIAVFTEQNGIVTSTVSLNAPTISKETAIAVASAAAKQGNSVSAQIVDKRKINRSIRTRKNARTLDGPQNPNSTQAASLIARIKSTLKIVTGKNKPEGE